ncbi:MAG TPA: hypothetical protein VEK56_14610, partial [Vicinamibacterales bacterium]|nr:hypothetical protein [Vicinamibacterales bacterium]
PKHYRWRNLEFRTQIECDRSDHGERTRQRDGGLQASAGPSRIQRRNQAATITRALYLPKIVM